MFLFFYFALYSIVFKVEFSLSRSYFFSPNRFDLGRVECINKTLENINGSAQTILGKQ